MGQGKVTAVGRFRYRFDAEIAQARLLDEGVPSALIAGVGTADRGRGAAHPVRLLVRAEQARRARSVLAERGRGAIGREGGR